jgi:hypothetical protein
VSTVRQLLPLLGISLILPFVFCKFPQLVMKIAIQALRSQGTNAAKRSANLATLPSTSSRRRAQECSSEYMFVSEISNLFNLLFKSKKIRKALKIRFSVKYDPITMRLELFESRKHAAEYGMPNG